MSEGAAISGATDAGDLDCLMNVFEQFCVMGLSDMMYEDFFCVQGIYILDWDENCFVEIAHFSDFIYFSNIVM